MKKITINQKDNGQWQLTMDESAMAALVSMVRLEYNNEWEGADEDTNDGGKRLAEAIEKAW